VPSASAAAYHGTGAQYIGRGQYMFTAKRASSTSCFKVPRRIKPQRTSERLNPVGQTAIGSADIPSVVRSAYSMQHILANDVLGHHLNGVYLSTPFDPTSYRSATSFVCGAALQRSSASGSTQCCSWNTIKIPKCSQVSVKLLSIGLTENIFGCSRPVSRCHSRCS
jgi:hypothetical protein